MIGHLRGKLAAKQAPELVVDVNGVGYELQAPMSTFYELPGLGSELSLYTHLLVREDAQQLYGFSTLAERRLFRALLKVTGVGARIALAILSGISVEGFQRCVQFEDVASLIKVPGIGKKTAERLIVEMRDKLGAPVAKLAVGGAPAPGNENPRHEAYAALLALGYRDTEINRMLKKVEGDDLNTEDLIRRALKGNG